jgi:hypothetical protein
MPFCRRVKPDDQSLITHHCFFYLGVGRGRGVGRDLGVGVALGVGVGVGVGISDGEITLTNSTVSDNHASLSKAGSDRSREIARWLLR